jgi:SAM-dependent methyltransferase
MTVERLLATLGPMLASTEALAAIGASLRLRHEGGRVEPELAVRLDAVLDALGIRELVNALNEQEASSLLGLVGSFVGQAGDLVAHPGRAGWDHEDADILVAQGTTSTLLARVFERSVVPSLGDDLVSRLDAGGASVLDVGAGVGALSIAMCRLWPMLRVVGIDPWEPALELARAHVAAAGLEGQIELRPEAVEQLEDTDAHDLAWVPAFFIRESVLEPALERVLVALRAGGGAIVGLYARPGNPLAAAVADLRTVRQGGALITAQELAVLMARVGFAGVEVLTDPAWPTVFVVGRRRSGLDLA